MIQNKTLGLIACVLMLSACGSRKEATKTQNGLTLNDSLMRVITVEDVTERPLADELTLNGKVDFNENEVARVSTMFAGTVTNVNAELGDHVNKGQVIAVIQSGDVAGYAKEKVEAQQQLVLAQRNMSATKDMYASGMASQKDVMQSKQDVANALAEVRRIRSIYSIYHLSSNSGYAIKAPVSGYIVQKSVNPQMLIRPEDGPIFTISGLSNVWVIANVYESDISKVHQGMSVKITTMAYPGKDFTGKIDKVYNMLDDDNKTMNVRICLPNKNNLLKPGMLANVYVENMMHGASMPCISAHDVVFDSGKRYVVVVGAANKLENREVEITKQNSHYAYVSAGLKVGDRVVNKNSLLVYNSLLEQQ